MARLGGNTSENFTKHQYRQLEIGEPRESYTKTLSFRVTPAMFTAIRSGAVTDWQEQLRKALAKALELNP